MESPGSIRMGSHSRTRTASPRRKPGKTEGAGTAHGSGGLTNRHQTPRTNGRGFFNVNSSHPFENATPLSNFFEMLAILVISAALCYTFGVMVGDRRRLGHPGGHDARIFVPLLVLCVGSEQRGRPRFHGLGIDQTASDMQAGGDIKAQCRLGIANSALWATATTAADLEQPGEFDAVLPATPLGGSCRCS